MRLKKFILYLVLYFAIFAGIYLFFVDKLANGLVDQYYNKFTQEAGSLIIGLSRADQGISPYVLDEELDGFEFDRSITNFAINAHQSKFGEVYLNAIQKKLTNKHKKNGFFIVSINPSSFSVPKTLNEDKVYENDKEWIIGKIENFTSTPNYDYIINTYPQPLYSGLLRATRDDDHHKIHTNGWTEIKLIGKNDTIKDNDISIWKNKNLEILKKNIAKERISKYRINEFVKTLNYLKTIGKVILVRIPSDIDILKIENESWPNFNTQFDSIANKYNIPYLNYSNQSDKYKTYDGSHLESESAEKFTRMLSLEIKPYLNSK